MGSKLLIEPRQDLWWGSGLSYNMTSTTKPSHHPGKSWLGEILMKIRLQLSSPDSPKESDTTNSATQVMLADVSIRSQGRKFVAFRALPIRPCCCSNFKGTEASWEGTKATFDPSPGAPRPV